jgi:alcohol dehydrogenase class IV
LTTLWNHSDSTRTENMQTVYHGCGSISSVRKIAACLKAQKILIVTGKQSFEASGAADALYRSLDSLDVLRFSNFDVNPSLEDTLPGIDLLQQFQPDLVIGIGGGSVIDMGKLITVLSAQPDDDYRSIVEKSSVSDKGVPVIAIPTTAGSGSEATRFAVIYIGGKKFSLAHPFVLPDYVIIDPQLTYKMSPYQAAASGMDALCQAVESYWSVNSTKQSRRFASDAIRIILPSIEDAVSGSSKQARMEMSRGAYYAGKAIDITMTTAPHALSYTLTSRYSIPHGHAVALILGKFFIINDLNSDALTDRRGKQFFLERLEALYAMFGCRNASSCAELWYQRMKNIGLETDFARLGITEQKDYKAIINTVNTERLKNHPVQLNRTLLAQIFK